MLADWYTPGVNVLPPNVPAATVVKGVSPDATPKAAVEEFCAASEAGSKINNRLVERPNFVPADGGLELLLKHRALADGLADDQRQHDAWNRRWNGLP